MMNPGRYFRTAVQQQRVLHAAIAGRRTLGKTRGFRVSMKRLRSGCQLYQLEWIISRNYP
jgi:hypothetical protein